MNATIDRKQDPKRFLSPEQIVLLGVIEVHPNAKWPVAIGRVDFPRAWQLVRQIADARRGTTG